MKYRLRFVLLVNNFFQQKLESAPVATQTVGISSLSNLFPPTLSCPPLSPPKVITCPGTPTMTPPQDSTSLVWMPKHFPSIWLPASSWWNPFLLIWMSLFRNKSITHLKTHVNMTVPYSHLSENSKEHLLFILTMYWKDQSIANNDERHFFLSLFFDNTCISFDH